LDERILAMSQNTIRKKPRYNKKFRFQLLAKWLIERYQPCRVLDVGGGKGLLSYLLIKNGWQATVVDPVEDVWLKKYKDLDSNKQIKLAEGEIVSVPRIKARFSSEMVADFDLVIGLHAHGSNMAIIDACAKYNKDFLLLPCCVIDEPIVKREGVDWLESLVKYAETKGFEIKRDTLFFKGQNVLIFTEGFLEPFC
jgi:SAM-dependent methyltransferase